MSIRDQFMSIRVNIFFLKHELSRINHELEHELMLYRIDKP